MRFRLVKESSLKSLADKIRAKAGTTEQLVFPKGFEDTVDGIATDTFHNDYWDNLMPEETSLWDSTLAQARINNKKVFRPNKNIKVTDGGVFRELMNTSYGLVDVPALCEELGITIDYSECLNGQYMHRDNTLFEHLGVVDCSNMNNVQGLFQYMSNLRKIDKWIVAENTVEIIDGNYWHIFAGCYLLTKLTVEGVIDFEVNFQETDLDAVSTISVLLALKDFTGTGNEFNRSALFNEAIWERVETSGVTPPSGNSWEEYAGNKGWITG